MEGEAAAAATLSPPQSPPPSLPFFILETIGSLGRCTVISAMKINLPTDKYLFGFVQRNKFTVISAMKINLPTDKYLFGLVQRNKASSCQHIKERGQFHYGERRFLLIINARTRLGTFLIQGLLGSTHRENKLGRYLTLRRIAIVQTGDEENHSLNEHHEDTPDEELCIAFGSHP